MNKCPLTFRLRTLDICVRKAHSRYCGAGLFGRKPFPTRLFPSRGLIRRSSFWPVPSDASLICSEKSKSGGGGIAAQTGGQPSPKRNVEIPTFLKTEGCQILPESRLNREKSNLRRNGMLKFQHFKKPKVAKPLWLLSLTRPALLSTKADREVGGDVMEGLDSNIFV